MQLRGDKDRVPLQWRNQFWQSLEEGIRKRCSQCWCKLKGDRSGDASWLKSVEIMQIVSSEGFILSFNQCWCKSTPHPHPRLNRAPQAAAMLVRSFLTKSRKKLARDGFCSFSLTKSRKRLVHFLLFIFVTPLIQIVAGHKMATLKVLFWRLSNANF